MLGCGPSLYALRSPALTLQANAQALERVLAAAGSPAPLGPAGTGAADTPGACAAVPRRARRAGGALALVSGDGARRAGAGRPDQGAPQRGAQTPLRACSEPPWSRSAGAHARPLPERMTFSCACSKLHW